MRRSSGDKEYRRGSFRVSNSLEIGVQTKPTSLGDHGNLSVYGILVGSMLRDLLVKDRASSRLILSSHTVTKDLEQEEHATGPICRAYVWLPL